MIISRGSETDEDILDRSIDVFGVQLAVCCVMFFPVGNLQRTRQSPKAVESVLVVSNALLVFLQSDKARTTAGEKKAVKVLTDRYIFPQSSVVTN